MSKRYLIFFALLLAVTLLSMKFLPAPYLWASLFCLLACMWLYFLEKTPGLKALLLNAMVVVLVLAGAEFYFWAPFAMKINAEGNMWKPEQFVKDDIRGYAPPKNAQGIVGKKYFGKTLIYDMSFSTDEYGLRKSYGHTKTAKPIVFFGCSVTFGDGVNDDQTVPYLVEKKSHHKLNSYNFAYSGYGAHQMLSILEHQLLPKILSKQPKYAIYTAVPGHISRSSGLQTWIVTAHDPRFEINDKDEIHFAGYYDDALNTSAIWKRRIRAYISNSHIARAMYTPFLFNKKRLINDQDVQRYIKIVAKARDVFEAQNPGAEFHVILWHMIDDENTKTVYDALLAGFEKNHLRVHHIKDILPKYYQNNPYYQIAHDSHPTPYANEIISDYILREIVKG